MQNKCSKSRVELGDKVVRCVSFFASHPSMCPEDQWHPHHIGEDFLLIDTYTAKLMAECECQLLVDPDDQQAEPTIVAVEMKALRAVERAGRSHTTTGSAGESDSLSLDKLNLE